MANQIDVEWHEVDRVFSGLGTDVEHKIRVKREAIPIIFVPGVMGSRLRRTPVKMRRFDTSGTDEADSPDDLRWDPTGKFLIKHFSGVTAADRKAMLIGERFDPNYLEVANSNPVGDGFIGLMEDYRPFLHSLRTRDWGPLGKLFVFPVFGFGYNWTDTNRTSGKKLAERIDEIIKEAREHIGLCQKVILITHSMGGLVARAACDPKMGGAEGNVLGVIHGVMPAFGAASAYWRMKAGFEAASNLLHPFKKSMNLLASRLLGPTGRDITALLANSMGGLQLLPSKLYETNDGEKSWLRITGSGTPGEPPRPQSGDPYAEIYRVPAGRDPSTYWGLVDPDLLAPEAANKPGGKALDQKSELMFPLGSCWDYYLSYLKEAEKFHDELRDYLHPCTWRFHGAGLPTAEWIELRTEIDSAWFDQDTYPARGFRSSFRDASGVLVKAVLQDPAGDGDGTVPVSSATMLDTFHPSPSAEPPDNQTFEHLEHQPAYENGEAQRWVVCAITALCQVRFKDRR